MLSNDSARALEIPEKLNEELAELKAKFNIDFVFFVDLTFTAHKADARHSRKIKDHDIRWTCLTRCADVDKERAEAMRESGCDIALFGVESLGKDVLKEARKGNTENLTIRAQRTVQEAGVRFGGLTIVGLPNETEESLDHMCKWAEENNHITRVKYLSLMPGTTVYNNGVRDGHIRSEIDHLNWLSIEQALHEDEFINVNGLPEQVMRDAYKRAFTMHTSPVRLWILSIGQSSSATITATRMMVKTIQKTMAEKAGVQGSPLLRHRLCQVLSDLL